MLDQLFKPMTMYFQNDDGEGGGGGDAPTILDESGNFTEDFYNSLPEDDRETIRRYKNPAGIAKGHMELRRTYNKPAERVVVLPNDESSEEEIAAYNQKIGVPEDPMGYEFELNPELNKIDIDEDKLNEFRKIAKKRGVPNSEFNGLVNDYLALINQEAIDYELIQSEKEVKEIEADNKVADEYFGKAKEDRIALADALLRKYSVELKNEKGEVVANAAEKLVEKYPGIEHSPYLVMILDKIRESMSPARLAGLTGTSTPTNAAIKVRIAEIRNNPAYTDLSSPDHKRLNEEVKKLYAQMG